MKKVNSFHPTKSLDNFFLRFLGFRNLNMVLIKGPSIYYVSVSKGLGGRVGLDKDY